MDVRKQVQLSFRKSFRFCCKGISYRFFRSSLTLAVVVVAVAFFMALLGESQIVRAVGRGVRVEVAAMREADALLNHLFYPHSSLGLSRKLARGAREGVEEFARVAGLTPEAAAGLAATCRVEQAYLAFFEEMNIGKRTVLVKKNKGRDVFSYLADPARWADFETNLAHLRSLRLPTEREPLRELVARWPAHLAALEAARRGWAATAERLQAQLQSITGGADVGDWMARAGDGDIERWRQAVTEAGFTLDAEAMRRVRGRLTVASLEKRLSLLLQADETRKAWKQAFHELPGVEGQLLQVKDPRAEAVLGQAFSAGQRAAVAADYAHARKLRFLEDKLPPPRAAGGDSAFLEGGQLFLVIISFLVCMVGITNAMLMSITERFREIATMKCLGATDGFILNQFLIEAAIQGLVGGTAGMLIGLAIALVKGTLLYGASVFAYFPGLPLLLCALITVAAGALLSMLASIYPSRAAAAMAPMDAMRIE